MDDKQKAELKIVADFLRSFASDIETGENMIEVHMSYNIERHTIRAVRKNPFANFVNTSIHNDLWSDEENA